MKYCLLYLIAAGTMTGCQLASSTETQVPVLVAGASIEFPRPAPDTIPPPARNYSSIEYMKAELLRAAPGTKSVLFNRDGSRLYAMNLEGMSIYEFDRASRKVLREFKFKPTRGTGWDYEKDKPIPSFQEKPVEACLTHDDRILWVSLHNAEGIVPIWLDSLNANVTIPGDTSQKKIRVIYPGTSRVDSFSVPLIKTGKTPKIIARTADNGHLLVSNWHSYTISVLELNHQRYPFGRVVSTIPMSAIPRGIAVDDRKGKSYIAIMGGASLSVINNSTWKKDSDINVASNPRHVVLDTSGRLFISYNSLGKIACLDPSNGTSLFEAATHGKPRTIILSRNQKFLFATCYASDTVDVFRINDRSFSKLISLPCKGHPVGVDVFEDDKSIEAWVCSYTYGTISVFSFAKKD